MSKLFEELDTMAQPFGVNSVEVGEDGGLRRLETRFPFSFRFLWRNARFEGSVRKEGDRLCLTLKTELGVLPFTAENSALRSSLLQTIAEYADDQGGDIRVENGHAAVLSREIDLPTKAALTVTTLVTNIAVAVLGAAPYLDLLSGRGLPAPAP